MQNKVAKFVTKDVDIYTLTRSLLMQCGWLSVKQLGFFHSVLLIWNTLQKQKPTNIHSKLIKSNTRSGTDGILKIPPTKTALASKSLMIKAILFWNQTPAEVKTVSYSRNTKEKVKRPCCTAYLNEVGGRGRVVCGDNRKKYTNIISYTSQKIL